MRNSCVYTVAELANVLKVSNKTVYKLIRTGKVENVRIGRQIRVSAQALDKFLQGESNG